MKLGILVFGLVSLCTTACVYTNIKQPLDRNFQSTELGSKEGRAKTTSILWLFAWGDAGARRAAENGEITIIRHADVEVRSYLFGLYLETTTIVYGD